MAQGVDFLIFVDTGTDPQNPQYTKVAGQRGGKFTLERDTIDATTKDGDGWTDSEYGLGSWSIEGDGLLVEGDAGQKALEDSLMNKTPVMVRWQTASGAKYEGQALVTSFETDAPHDDDATWSIKLKGKGQPTKTTGA